MRHISEQDQPQYRVTAVFETGAFSFDMSKGATFERLSSRLAHLGKQHGEPLTAVQVTKAWKRPRNLRI